MNARMQLDWDETKVKASVSPEEWQTRVDLAACYRAVAVMWVNTRSSQPIDRKSVV